MRIVLGSDHGGLRLKKEIKELLTELGIAYEDVGCDCEESVDYPDYAFPVAEKVANGEFDLGILICGTGIGNANILALGERVVGPDLAKSIVRAWLSAEFQGNRHARRLEKISQLEGSYS
jgi:ribose 5-phosphate isomerase B